jgi:hypothetical protein
VQQKKWTREKYFGGLVMAYLYGERKQFNTLGELRKLTEKLADNTVVTICGAAEAGFFHIREDRALITLDYDALDDCCYTDEENYETEGEVYMDF